MGRSAKPGHSKACVRRTNRKLCERFTDFTNPCVHSESIYIKISINFDRLPVFMNINAGVDVEISNGELYLPKDVYDKYIQIGIKSIFQWQADCLSIPGVLGNACAHFAIVRWRQKPCLFSPYERRQNSCG